MKTKINHTLNYCILIALMMLSLAVSIVTVENNQEYHELKPQVTVSYLLSNKPQWRINVTNDYQWWMDSNGTRVIQINFLYGNKNGIKVLDHKQ